GQATVNEKAAARGQEAPKVPGGPDAAKVAAAANAPLAVKGAAAAGGASNAQGETVFKNNCASCHGAEGKGTPGAFPPLAGNPDVSGDAKNIIHIVDAGHTGAMTINGQTYNGTMPPWKGNLKPEDIAAVVTYIRTSWGNTGTPVTVKDVEADK